MKRWIKRIAVAVLGIVVVLGMAGATVYGVGGRYYKRTYDIKAESVSVPNDGAAIERGKHIANAIAKCTDCHGANLQGNIMIDAPMFVRLAASNLTSGKGGVAANYKTDADWVRAIRHGVRPDGSALVFMPSQYYNQLSDQDLGDLIAYVKSMAPQDNEVAARKIGPIARALTVAKKLPPLPVDQIDHDAPRPAAVAPGVTVEYGEYLSTIGGCKGCHRENLAGGPDKFGPPGAPAPSNLTPGGGMANWSEQDFFNALRTGKRPDGSNIDPFMPWRFTAQMTDDEIRATWLYLKSLPPTPTATE